MSAPRAGRRLAAILAMDVVGYSRLMGRDEAGTLARLAACRREIIVPLVAEHHGRVVNVVGDAALCEFASVVDAVAAAVAIQAAIEAREPDLAAADRLRLRIGVNLGDVIVEGSEIYGDGVNVAARLEALAEPGGIVVSAAVRDQLAGKLDLELSDLGERRLKNIDRPVRAYRVGGPAAAGPAASAAASALSCIAVLPFDDMGSEPAQSWFSDGITEDVITELSRFRELLVIARNSSFTFRGRATDVREIGRALGATHVVEGSVRRAAERVRITAQLVDAGSGAHLWAERYERPLADVFAVQAEIASGIAAAVAQRVIEERSAVARRRPPADLRAYDVFLQARAIADTFTPEAQDQARRLYEEAIRLDPGLARAWIGLAYNHMLRAQNGAMGRPLRDDPDRAAALRLVEHALTLDPTDARVHGAVGFVSLLHRMFDRALRHVEVARALNPNDAGIQGLWGWTRACLGEAELGLQAWVVARRLDPRYPDWFGRYEARSLFLARRHAESAAMLAPLVATNPLEHPRDLGWLVAALGHQGAAEEAGRRAAELVAAIGRRWQGDPDADAAARLSWLVDTYPLRRAEDVEHLRDGLRRAGALG